MHFLKLLRLHHCVKNLLVIAPIVFGGQVTDMNYLMPALAAFVGFSFIASFVYVLNDICDVERDRCHPKKKMRPIASGAVSVPSAILLAATMVVLAVIALNFSIHPWKMYALGIVYVGINIAYSYGLKNFPVVDVAILASGFLLRLIFGSVATDVPISHLMALTVLMGACYIGLGKRRNELRNVTSGNTRHVLRYYTVDYLDKHMYLCMGLSLTFYALWCLSQHAIGMIWTVPLALFIFMRYNLAIERESDGDPVDVLLGDKTLLATTVVFAIILLTLLYFTKMT